MAQYGGVTGSDGRFRFNIPSRPTVEGNPSASTERRPRPPIPSRISQRSFQSDQGFRAPEMVQQENLFGPYRDAKSQTFPQEKWRGVSPAPSNHSSYSRQNVRSQSLESFPKSSYQTSLIYDTEEEDLQQAIREMNLGDQLTPSISGGSVASSQKTSRSNLQANYYDEIETILNRIPSSIPQRERSNVSFKPSQDTIPANKRPPPIPRALYNSQSQRVFEDHELRATNLGSVSGRLQPKPMSAISLKQNEKGEPELGYTFENVSYGAFHNYFLEKSQERYFFPLYKAVMNSEQFQDLLWVEEMKLWHPAFYTKSAPWEAFSERNEARRFRKRINMDSNYKKRNTYFSGSFLGACMLREYKRWKEVAGMPDALPEQSAQRFKMIERQREEDRAHDEWIKKMNKKKEFLFDWWRPKNDWNITMFKNGLFKMTVKQQKKIIQRKG